MATIRAITLDASNTLMRVVGGVGHQYAAVARQMLGGVVWDEQTVERVFAAAFRHMSEQFPNFGAQRQSQMTSRQWWGHIARRIAHHLSPGLSDSLVAEFGACLYDRFAQAEGYALYDDTIPALDALRARGLRLGVISNFDERLRGVLQALHIADRFDFVLTSYEFGVEKPDRRIFERAATLAEVPLSRMLHVGDSIRKDVQGARDAGARALLIRRQQQQQQQQQQEHQTLQGNRSPVSRASETTDASPDPGTEFSVASLLDVVPWLEQRHLI